MKEQPLNISIEERKFEMVQVKLFVQVKKYL